MRFMEDQRSNNAIDVQLQAFIEQESKNQQFQRLALNLTDTCWKVCVGTPGRSLDSSTRDCLINCVDRFIDTSNFLAYKLEKFLTNSKAAQ